MLIEQIIEFEWRGPGPPGRTCSLITVYFYDKMKISKENLQVDYYLLQNNSTGGNVPSFSLLGPNHLQNLAPECKILNVFWP